MTHYCSLHPQMLLGLFCETCRDPICTSCSSLGPHATQHHQVLSLSEAAALRRAHFSAYFNAQVQPLREKAGNRLVILQREQEKLQSERAVVEKDLALEFDGLEGRLKQKENEEALRCNAEMKRLQQYLNGLDDLAYSFQSTLAFPHKFLLLYKSLDAGIRRLIATDPPSKTEHPPLLLPREIAQAHLKAQLLPHYEAKNKFMNGLIARTLRFRLDELSTAKKEVKGRQRNTYMIFNGANQKLLGLQSARACAFCGCAFSIGEVNQPCLHNKSYKSEPKQRDVVIAPELRGSKMHVWLPVGAEERKIPDVKLHSLLKVQAKKHFFNCLRELKQVRCKLRAYEIDKEKHLAWLDPFKADDLTGRGAVSRLAFRFIMTNKFEVPQDQVQSLISLLDASEEGSPLVAYSRLQAFLADPLEIYRKFQEAEQELEKAKPIAPPSLRYRY